ncbi:MAG: DeoR/GlpR family DNA-binding transcription regulator [Atopobiaceae bacterium]|nr:DeoR/GlpR family DNA-binding transcription regulator [Atopobiaceae bacterium]MCI1497919.1 DeoR/GlpR family DNA-binding transcription regulator [Atopobiaceae bacterium]MCI1539670.1 DeoR/GlpR family DNA-binding transcription regulator [Atopobiaceae bacterium]
MADQDSGQHLFLEERQQQIQQMVTEQSTVTIAQIVERFGVSAATARKDLRELEAQGKVRRTHGGAMSIKPNERELRAASSATLAHEEKIRIGRAAAELVNDGDVFLVQAGTTNLEFVRALRGKHDLTIVTNDTMISTEADALLSDSSVLQLGGRIRFGFHYTEGILPAQEVSELMVPTVYLCTNAFSFERGFATHRPEQATWLKLLMDHSQRHVILLDSTKMGVSAAVHHNDLADFDVLVTDTGVSSEYRARIAAEAPDLEVIYA